MQDEEVDREEETEVDHLEDTVLQASPLVASTPKRPMPPTKRRRVRKNEAPVWFKSSQDKNHELLERLVLANERKNQIMEAKTKLLEQILEKL